MRLRADHYPNDGAIMKCCCHPLKKKKKKKNQKYAGGHWASWCHSLPQRTESRVAAAHDAAQNPHLRIMVISYHQGGWSSCFVFWIQKKFKTHWGKIIPCLRNIICHKIFSLSRIPSHDVQINISDCLSPESDFASEHLRSCFFSSSEFFFFSSFFFPLHTVIRAVSQVLAYAVISNMGQWADNRMHKRLCQKSSGLICTSYQITT